MARRAPAAVPLEVMGEGVVQEVMRSATGMLAAQSIKLGYAHVVVAGGMENMSLAPYLLLQARQGYRMGMGFSWTP